MNPKNYQDEPDLVYGGVGAVARTKYCAAFLATLKGTIDTIGIIALLAGTVLTVGGLITHLERK